MRYKIVSIAILIFILASLPLFMTTTLPFEGDDITFHAYLVKIILEEGTIPAYWYGLSDGQPMIYPFGVHAVAAALTVGGLIPILNVLFLLFPILFTVFCLSIYPLARELGLDKQQSFLCIVIVGFGSLFALFPLVWGGIAQLFGMVMLNITFYLMVRYVNRKDLRSWVFYTLSICALFLAYYWMFIIFCIGMVCFWLRGKGVILNSLKGFYGLLIISPWIYILAYNILNGIGTDIFSHYQAFVPILKSLIVINPIILGLAIYSYNRKYLPFYVWIVISIAMLFSQYFGILGFFNPSRWMYSLSIPLAITASVGFFKLYRKIDSRVDRKTLYVAFVAGMVVVSASYYMYQNLVTYPGVSEEDWLTIRFVRDVVPENKSIYVVGKSGTWIPFIADRPIMNPKLSSMTVDESFIVNRYALLELYEDGEWGELGADYYFISEKEAVPEDCNVVYGRLFECGGES